MKKLLLILSILFIPVISWAGATTGGVNWKDPLGYTKPQFYPITVPDEVSSSKYYVDLDSGSDSANCTTTGTPCRTLNGLAGKAYSPLRGGPAYVYVQGNGNFSITGTMYGSAGNEVVIKNWNSTGEMTLSGSNLLESYSNGRYLIIDGGPNMLFKFNGVSGYGEGNSNGYAVNINTNYLTFYRVQFDVYGGTQAVGIARHKDGVNGNVIGTKFINCEFYDSDTTPSGTAPLLYPGSGTNCSGQSSIADETYVINNIFRGSGPSAIEWNPRNDSTGVYIYGNAFHTNGSASCGTGWACRPHIIIDGPSCSGSTTNVHIENNIMWDSGSGGVWTRGGTSAIYIYNNTIYDYGNGSGGGGANPQGISGYVNGGQGTIRNNIIFDAGGVNPFDSSSYTASNNLCLTSESCGTSSQTDSAANIFISTSTSSADYLKIKTASKAIDNGYATGITTSYFGDTRSGTLDIGADEYGDSSPSTPSAFTGTLSGGKLN